MSLEFRGIEMAGGGVGVINECVVVLRTQECGRNDLGHECSWRKGEDQGLSQCWRPGRGKETEEGVLEEQAFPTPTQHPL